MRVLRLAAILLLIVMVLIGGAAVALVANQDRVMARVLDGVHQRTGLEITGAATHLRLSSHLILEFDHPRIARDGKELGRLDSARAVVTYHSILFSGGVPLYSLVLVHPDFQLPKKTGFAMTTPLPRIGTELVNTVVKLLHGLERASWRIEVVDATVHGPDGSVLFDQLGFLAFRRHR